MSFGIIGDKITGETVFLGLIETVAISRNYLNDNLRYAKVFQNFIGIKAEHKLRKGLEIVSRFKWEKEKFIRNILKICEDRFISKNNFGW